MELCDSKGDSIRAAVEAELTAQPALSGELAEAFGQLFDALEATETAIDNGQDLPGEAVTEVGEYALQLFDQAILAATDPHPLQTQAIAVARWIVAHGGRIQTLEPVVDALARHANHSRDPKELAGLFAVMSDILQATDETVRRAGENTGPGHPWRVLILNRAIVATRSLRPELMTVAFDTLSEKLPDQAPGFFSEGMKQMDLLNYPSEVREVMGRYYRKWHPDRSLH
ncbi:MAG TPA: hypothetical protein ENJ79_08105 [Gammaproteobacteria bacterium]|nr:hypothetical protein [Gammaproteobacteria bacterium]